MKTRAIQNLILIRSKGRGIWYLEEYGRNTGIDLSMRIIRSEDVSQGIRGLARKNFGRVLHYAVLQQGG